MDEPDESAAVPTREVMCAPAGGSEMRCREEVGREVKKRVRAGVDEKGKEREWGQSRTLYQECEETVMRAVIGWDRPWAKDGSRWKKLGTEWRSWRWRGRWRGRKTTRMHSLQHTQELWWTGPSCRLMHVSGLVRSSACVQWLEGWGPAGAAMGEVKN